MGWPVQLVQCAECHKELYAGYAIIYQFFVGWDETGFDLHYFFCGKGCLETYNAKNGFGVEQLNQYELHAKEMHLTIPTWLHAALKENAATPGKIILHEAED